MRPLNQKVYGKQLVIACNNCHRIRRFGHYVRSIFSYDQLQARYEVVEIQCPDCEKAFHND